MEEQKFSAKLGKKELERRVRLIADICDLIQCQLTVEFAEFERSIQSPQQSNQQGVWYGIND